MSNYCYEDYYGYYEDYEEYHITEQEQAERQFEQKVNKIQEFKREVDNSYKYLIAEMQHQVFVDRIRQEPKLVYCMVCKQFKLERHNQYYNKCECCLENTRWSKYQGDYVYHLQGLSLFFNSPLVIGDTVDEVMNKVDKLICDKIHFELQHLKQIGLNP